MESFLKLFFVTTIFTAWNDAVNGQYFPRQIMPINSAAATAQSQFNPFLSNYQLIKMQQQIQQQQQLQQQQQQQAMFQLQQPQMPMQRAQGILQSPATDISNPPFQQQQQQSRTIPFQISFNGQKKSSEQIATPFNGGGLVPITEKLLDSNSEHLPSSVGNVKRDSSMPDNNSVQPQSQSQSTPSSPTPPIESLPPFLQGAPKDIIDEFKRILRQPQTSYDEKVQQVQALILTLSPDRQQIYNQFMGQQQQQQQQQQSSTSLPPPSPQLLYRQPTRSPSRMPQQSLSNNNKNNNDGFSKITRILQDESIPENERWKQIVGIYGEIEPRVKSENPFAFDEGLMK